MDSILGRIHLSSLVSRSWTSRVQNASVSSFTFQKDPNSDGDTSQSKKNKRSFVDRISAVIDRLHDRKLPHEIRGKGNEVKSETDLINIVERRIWHSMEEGQFENLPGKGKPLNLNSNPHADPAEDTLYRVLSKNGFAPEWVERNKEIRIKITEWRKALKKEWAKKLAHGDVNWKEDSVKLQQLLRDINKKVFHYNLVAPFGLQMFGIKWEKELQQMEHPDS